MKTHEDIELESKVTSVMNEAVHFGRAEIGKQLAVEYHNDIATWFVFTLDGLKTTKVFKSAARLIKKNLKEIGYGSN